MRSSNSVDNAANDKKLDTFISNIQSVEKPRQQPLKNAPTDNHSHMRQPSPAASDKGHCGSSIAVVNRRRWLRKKLLARRMKTDNASVNDVWPARRMTEPNDFARHADCEVEPIARGDDFLQGDFNGCSYHVEPEAANESESGNAWMWNHFESFQCAVYNVISNVSRPGGQTNATKLVKAVSIPTPSSEALKRVKQKSESTRHYSFVRRHGFFDAFTSKSSSSEIYPEAENRPPIGFSFSPAGLLLPYHLGVVACLQDFGYITPTTPLAGASAGALAAITAASGVSTDVAMRANHRVESDIRVNGAARRLHEVLQRELEAFVPENAHDLINNRPGKVFVAYTNVWPLYKAQFVSKFENRGDLIECILASCNVPFYFSTWPTVTCRGKHSIDGYFCVSRKHFGCPKTGALRNIKISPFPARVVRLSHVFGDSINPDIQNYDNKLEEECGGISQMKCYLSGSTPPPFTRPNWVPDSYLEHMKEESCATPVKSKTPEEASHNKPAAERSKFPFMDKIAGSYCGNYLTRYLSSQSPQKEKEEEVEAPPGHKQLGDGHCLDGDYYFTASPSSPSSSAISKSKMETSFGACCETTTNPVHTAKEDVNSGKHDEVPRLRFSVKKLLKLALDSKTDDVVEELFELGRADAFRWVKIQEMSNSNVKWHV